jgi:hypothetical protein
VPYFVEKGIGYTSFDACYADRVNHRQEWYEQIKAYNEPDGARLGRDLFAQYDIYTGIRNVAEFNAIKAARLFDFSVWVDRSKHVPPEPSTSNTMSPWMADYVLNNNGTLQDLEDRTRRLYQVLRDEHIDNLLMKKGSK